MRVVIADDEERIQSALSLLIEQQPDMEVVGSIDCATYLLNVLQSAAVDLLLLDWELPGMTHNLIKQIHKQNPAIIVVVLSSQPEARRPALTAGAKLFVSKSESPQVVMNVLQSCQETL